MPNDTIGSVQRVTIAWMQPDQQVQECNLCYVATAVGAGDSRGQLAFSVYTLFKTNWLPQLAPATIMYGWKISSVNAVPAMQPRWNVAVGDVGGAANPVAPTQTRPILRLATAFAGRKYRGRIFLPTPSAAALANTGFPSAANTAAAQALGTALLTPIVQVGTTWQLVIAHRVPKLPASTTTTPVAGALASGLFGTQRRSGNTGRLNPNPW